MVHHRLVITVSNISLAKGIDWGIGSYYFHSVGHTFCNSMFNAI
jgi:hypothetical protein